MITYGDSQKLPANTLMATGATDSQGNLTFSGLYPHGDYYIKELSVPNGWLLGAQTYPVTLTPNHKASGENVITVYLDQPILNRLMYTPVTLTKTDITGAEKRPARSSRSTTRRATSSTANTPMQTARFPTFPLCPAPTHSRKPMRPPGTR